MTLQPRAAIQTARRYALALGALRALAPTEANAIGKMCLFSAVHRVVLDHGKPVAGATIERSYHWSWNDQNGKLVGWPISLVSRLEAELKRRCTVYGICEPQ